MPDFTTIRTKNLDLDLEDEEIENGDRTPFVLKINRMMDKIVNAFAALLLALGDVNSFSQELNTSGIIRARLAGRIHFRTYAGLAVYGRPEGAGTETSPLAEVWQDGELSGVYGWDENDARWNPIEHWTKGETGERGLQGVRGEAGRLVLRGAEAISPNTAARIASGEVAEITLVGDSWSAQTSIRNGLDAYLGVNMTHFGYGGKRSNEIASDPEYGDWKDAIAISEPDMVIVVCGVNDHTFNNTPGLAADSVALIFETIRARTPESELLMLIPAQVDVSTYQGAPGGAGQTPWREYRDAISDRCDQEGIARLDLGTVLDPYTEGDPNWRDYAHPSDLGGERIAALVHRHIANESDGEVLQIVSALERAAERVLLPVQVGSFSTSSGGVFPIDLAGAPANVLVPVTLSEDGGRVVLYDQSRALGGGRVVRARGKIKGLDQAFIDLDKPGASLTLAWRDSAYGYAVESRDVDPTAVTPVELLGEFLDGRSVLYDLDPSLASENGNPADASAIDSWANAGTEGAAFAAQGPASGVIYRSSSGVFAGRPVLDMSSGGSIESAGSLYSQPFTVVVVAAVTPTSGRRIISSADENFLFDMYINSASLSVSTASGAFTLPGGSVDADPHVYAAVCSGAESSMHSDDVSRTITTSGQSSGIHVGAYADGRFPSSPVVARAFVVGGALTASEIDKLISLCRKAYGVA